jgi:hypothetical protein
MSVADRVVLRIDLISHHAVVLVDFHDAIPAFGPPTAADVAIEEVAPFA